MFSTPEIMITEDVGQIPQTWTRAGALALDTQFMAGVWMGYERSTDTIHIYDAHVAMRSSLAMLAESAWERGKWIPLLFDPTGNKRGEDEGLQIAERLADLRLPLQTATADLDAAIELCTERFETGKLKISSHLSALLTEYRRFGRNDKGEPAFTGNILLQAMFLLVTYGIEIAISEAKAQSDERGIDPYGEHRMDVPSTGY